jgi:hypothetical protein
MQYSYRVGSDERRLSDGDIDAARGQRINLTNKQLDDYEQIRKVPLIRRISESVRRIAALQKIKIDRQAVERRYHEETERTYSGAAEG